MILMALSLQAFTFIDQILETDLAKGGSQIGWTKAMALSCRGKWWLSLFLFYLSLVVGPSRRSVCGWVLTTARL